MDLSLVSFQIEVTLNIDLFIAWIPEKQIDRDFDYIFGNPGFMLLRFW